MEVQFDEHKLLVVYAHDLEPFEAVLRQAGRAARRPAEADHRGRAPAQQRRRASASEFEQLAAASAWRSRRSGWRGKGLHPARHGRRYGVRSSRATRESLRMDVRGHRFVFVVGVSGSGTTMTTRILGAAAARCRPGGNHVRVPADDPAVLDRLAPASTTPAPVCGTARPTPSPPPPPVARWSISSANCSGCPSALRSRTSSTSAPSRSSQATATGQTCATVRPVRRRAARGGLP